MRNLKRLARLAVGLGTATALTAALTASAFASSPIEPTLTPHHARFVIPATAHWTLQLWGCEGTDGACDSPLLGWRSATSGTITLNVKPVPDCHYQVDVSRDYKWYSGFKTTLTHCGRGTPPPTTTTLPPTTTTTAKPEVTTTTVLKRGKGSTTTTTPGQPSTGVPGHGGSPPSGPTAVPSGSLAFTGAGVGLYVIAGLGLALSAAGAGLLLYARRYAALRVRA